MAEKEINKTAETNSQNTSKQDEGNAPKPSHTVEKKTDKKTQKNKKDNKQNKNSQKNTVNNNDVYNKYDYVLKNRKIRKHEKQQKLIKILLIFLAISIVLGGGVYGMMTMLEHNHFKVLIDKEGLNILSLSHSEDFAEATEVLSLQGPRYMDNITLMDVYDLLPEIEATEGNYGAREEKNFVASTFYLKNVSGKDQYITESIIINNVTKNVDDAIRVMVIRNGERKVYAKENKDGEPEEVVPGQYYTEEGELTHNPEKVWMSVPFASPRHVFYDTGISLPAGEVRKYTVFVWLEGWDPECVNEILGGTIKLEFHFTQQTR